MWENSKDEFKIMKWLYVSVWACKYYQSFFENIGPLAAESKEQRGENSDLFVTGQDG